MFLHNLAYIVQDWIKETLLWVVPLTIPLVLLVLAGTNAGFNVFWIFFIGYMIFLIDLTSRSIRFNRKHKNNSDEFSDSVEHN